MKLTILCENSVARPGNLIGEHGFACLLETPAGNYLIDTGTGHGLLHNAAELGKDLSTLQGVILSHGHRDHTGGLTKLLTHLDRQIAIHAHPELFIERFWKSAFELRPIGIPFTRQQLEELEGSFRLERGLVRINESLTISSEIPHRTSFEKGDPHLVVKTATGSYVQDPLRDDLSVALSTSKGLVIVLGCAHAGVINIIEHFLEQTGADRIHALIGGTHLGPASEEQYQATVGALKRYRIDKIATSHCTGLNRSAQLAHEFSGRFSFAATGMTLEFD